ncbi:MAG: pyruvate:ferredoxin (flavodoxin) oxidoreductase [Planctomycetota bacterium]
MSANTTSAALEPRTVILDGNEAVASVAYRLSEVIAIYPITPATPMGEWADAWAADGRPNVWGSVPTVVEMQSEAGAAGAVHGALQTGALATTFTASQGLLLMLPNMFKIAGELSAAVIHVASRAIATHALSIFGDHSDVMAARSTGFALLSSGSVQEAQDLAAVAHATTLRARVPILHFMDGFRTSHEVASVKTLRDEDLRMLVDEADVLAHRGRGLDPDRPAVRGTAQNPDVFFQAREAQNRFYTEFPDILRAALQRFGDMTGRRYGLVDYVGAKNATRVVVAMGSACETLAETVSALTAAGEDVGLLRLRLFRPFPLAEFLAAVPPSARSVAVLDRCKEPGALGEPLYQEVVTAFAEGRADARPRVIGGRYGLGSKEFTPAMAKAVFDELARPQPRNHFTVGIDDDVTGTSLACDRAFVLDRDPETTRAVFTGLGSDGTVGANKNSIKIIGDLTGQRVQAYFVYDSKKAGAVTVSHLRFGEAPIGSSYLIEPGTAGFVACHHPRLLQRDDVLSYAAEGATVLLNVPWSPDEVFGHLPEHVRQTIADKRLRVFAVDALAVARAAGLGHRISTVMQACFFKLCPVLPFETALDAIRRSILKTFGKRGDQIVQRNVTAVESAVAGMFEVVARDAPVVAVSTAPAPNGVSAFVREVTLPMIAGHGERLPVSKMPQDGTFPSGTARFEKRGIADHVPVWEPDLCIECARCALVCPHAAIRIKVFDADATEAAPSAFKTRTVKAAEHRGRSMSIQVAPDDCTGCELCVRMCPAKDKAHPAKKAINMAELAPILPGQRAAFSFFLDLPAADRAKLDLATVRGSQVVDPLFEFSGACAGCGETPYLKLLSQMFGDRAVVANATGCSSIYGGNLPTTPWSVDRHGRGPAWSNSLFEDAAEFGFGFRCTLDQQRIEAIDLVRRLTPILGEGLASELLALPRGGDVAVQAQRDAVARLRQVLAGVDVQEARRLSSLADALVDRSVWVVGGDGWAYDIGFSGLDHVLASGRNVNILVLDTEVYSNTGGQTSKATSRAAVAKFSALGKRNPKKDLGAIAMAHGHVYVATVALCANDKQVVRAFAEAESYDGPSIILAYSHCIAHGFDLAEAAEHQAAAVTSGYWPLYRHDPRRLDEAKNPLQLDSRKPTLPFWRFAERESRFHMLTRSHPELARQLQGLAQQDIDARWHMLEQMAAASPHGVKEP